MFLFANFGVLSRLSEAEKNRFSMRRQKKVLKNRKFRKGDRWDLEGTSKDNTFKFDDNGPQLHKCEVKSKATRKSVGVVYPP